MIPATLPPAPVGEIAKRLLQFFWLADNSGSMGGAKIASLNQAIREALPEIRRAVDPHPQVQVMMRAVRFSSTAAWHVGPQPVPLDKFTWHDLKADASTATHAAIDLMASELDLDKMPRQGLPPVAILISDGSCDDRHAYEQAIAKLKALPWGLKAVRLAIGIGAQSGGGYDEAELLKFVSHPEVGVLKADSPEKLTAYIKWASVAATIGASVGRSKIDTASTQHVILPTSQPTGIVTSASDLF